MADDLIHSELLSADWNGEWCACKLVGGGLMILLNGISELGIFGHLRLLRMPGIL
ncbi:MULTISPECIES: hypothetical protein [unclassified Collinsella]|uniref:hypothetical protein n=1 Tax=unclassified Collinsella TaxID=2637548 RepID=UPI0018F20D60|nr:MULTISPECIES: hypothetical protein [unclassified Collinsella]